MEHVQEFMSDRPLPSPEKREMRDVFKALSLNLKIAENILARVAKEKLASELKDVSRKISNQDDIPFPVWSTLQAVAMTAPVNDGELEGKAEVLDRLVARIVTAVIDETEEHGGPILVDALSVAIHPVDSGLFNFVLKQKFAVKHE